MALTFFHFTFGKNYHIINIWDNTKNWYNVYYQVDKIRQYRFPKLYH